LSNQLRGIWAAELFVVRTVSHEIQGDSLVYGGSRNLGHSDHEF